MQKDHLVPISILLGCGMIAAGLYFGLRSQPPPGPSPDASPAATGAATSGVRPTVLTAPPHPVTPPPGPAVAGAPVLPAVPAEVQAAAERAANEAVLAEKKKTYVPKCWEPALAKAPQPAVAKYKLDMMFDPQGKQIGLGLQEDRSALRTDVANCIRDQGLTLQISPPPGVHVHVLVPLELP